MGTKQYHIMMVFYQYMTLDYYVISFAFCFVALCSKGLFLTGPYGLVCLDNVFKTVKLFKSCSVGTAPGKCHLLIDALVPILWNTVWYSNPWWIRYLVDSLNTVINMELCVVMRAVYYYLFVAGGWCGIPDPAVTGACVEVHIRRPQFGCRHVL